MAHQSPITCHVLDASTGKPAPYVFFSLEKVNTDPLLRDPTGKSGLPEFEVIATGSTNQDGRCPTILPPDYKVQPGIYKMIFHTGTYFESRNVETFYPCVTINFNYKDPNEHYHIPLLISPFSYTTYRGS